MSVIVRLLKKGCNINMSISWKNWNPGLKNDKKTLGKIKATLPGAKQQDISAIVQLLENPGSPIALTGAVTLEHHDCIHILLGRGLLNQDEAFVIGYTMGSSKDISKLEEFIFRTIASNLYPRNYRLNSKHLKVYNLALEAGKKSKVKKLCEFPFEKYYDWKLGDLRKKLGINKKELKKLYQLEREMLPHTTASKRL